MPCIEFLSSGSKTPLMFGCSTAGEKPESCPGAAQQDLVNEGVLFPIFFHQEGVEVNTCHRRAGKDQGVIPVQGEHGTALNQRQSYRNLFSAIISSFLPHSSWLCYTPGLSNVTCNSWPSGKGKSFCDFSPLVPFHLAAAGFLSSSPQRWQNVTQGPSPQHREPREPSPLRNVRRRRVGTGSTG